MTATPIVAGLMYRVTGQGQDRVIFASHPVDALCIALAQIVFGEAA